MEHRVRALEEAVSTLTVYIKRLEKKHKKEMFDLQYDVDSFNMRMEIVERDNQQLDWTNKSCDEIRGYIDKLHRNLYATWRVLGENDPNFQDTLQHKIKQHEDYVTQKMKEFERNLNLNRYK
jgi:hypothetical protein